MTINRAPASDWDKIASFTGDSSFTWNNIMGYIQRVRAIVAGAYDRYFN
jgi:hypothetical protein